MKLSKIIIAASLVAVSTSSFAKFDKQEKFDVKLKLFTPIAITEQAAMVFPDKEAGADDNTPLAHTSGAQFDITGLAGEVINLSVQDVTMITGDGVGVTKQIPVGNFTWGTDCTVGGTDNDATATLTGGTATCTIGATADVDADNIGGQYTVENTLTVGYQ